MTGRGGVRDRHDLRQERRAAAPVFEDHAVDAGAKLRGQMRLVDEPDRLARRKQRHFDAALRPFLRRHRGKARVAERRAEGVLGRIDAQRPRMVSVQASGCAPIVKAFDEDKAAAEPWQNAQTIASGLRVPQAVGDFLMLQAIRESGGTAVSVSDDELRAAQVEMARETGIYTCPEGGATWAALKRLRKNSFLSGDEDVVLFATGIGTKSEAPIAI